MFFSKEDDKEVRWKKLSTDESYVSEKICVEKLKKPRKKKQLAVEEVEIEEDILSEEDVTEEDVIENLDGELKKGDCVIIIDGSFKGYYAMLCEDIDSDDLIEINYLQKTLGKYVLKRDDKDYRLPQDFKKVNYKLHNRSRYEFY